MQNKQPSPVHPGGIGAVDGIVAGKGVRVVGLKDRIAAEEAADHGIVDAGAEVDDAERGQQIAAVPLLVFVVGRAGRGAGLCLLTSPNGW